MRFISTSARDLGFGRPLLPVADFALFTLVIAAPALRDFFALLFLRAAIDAMLARTASDCKPTPSKRLSLLG